MADNAEKKVVNPRVEIDTSPPFESVKEAVHRFGGGGGPWIPLHLLRLAATAQCDDSGGVDVSKMEQQTALLENDLLIKEQATLNILKELEVAKRFVSSLKATLTSEASSLPPSPGINLPLPNQNSFCPGLMFVELNQAKLKFTRTSVDLALIQASVGSLNQKIRAEKVLLEKGTKMQVPDSEVVHDEHCKPTLNHEVSAALCNELNFEAEQFKKMTEASRYEVIKAMTEIERTKNSIKMAEMRINAAKKMEEAAKAVEAIAHVEGNVSENSLLHSVTLSFDEFHALTRKAQQAEDLICKTKFIDTNAVQIQKFDVPDLEKFEEIPKDRFRFRNSHSTHHRTQNIIVNKNSSTKEQPLIPLTSTTSIGDILNRKLVVQEGIVVSDDKQQHVSLSEMLQEQSRRVVVQAPGDGVKVEKKQILMQRKKFGFMQVPIRRTKKKTHPLN